MRILLYILLTACLVMAMYINTVSACELDNVTDEQIVNAIYKAENSDKYPYGIKSLKYEDRSDRELSRHDWARQICFNTVRNNRKRYIEYGHKKYDCFIEFLGSRYCPVDAHKLNVNWVKNVKWFIKRGGSNGEDTNC